MYDVLEPGADGWLRGGEPWEPTQPFYAVLGDPIAHSLSPTIQNAALREREIDTEYVPVRIDAGRLRSLKDGPLGRLLAGFNVTAPHKEAVAALCDGRTEQARDMGAVNTVKVEDGRWLGHNTDSGGVLTVVAQIWGAGTPPEQAVVLGAGGSARAAVDALLRWDIPRVEVHSRSAEGRARLAGWLESRELADRVDLRPLAEGPPAPTGSSIWICCLAGGVDASGWLPAAAGEAPAVLLDLRYGDQLPANQAPLGFRFSDGLPVLLMQGGLSFAWWFGPPVPWSAMSGALT
jgi:shikimate dehydrogenase